MRGTTPAYLIGKLVYDCALGRNGIVIDGPNTEIGDGSYYAAGEILKWDWRVLYENGELMGADTSDLQEVIS